MKASHLSGDREMSNPSLYRIAMWNEIRNHPVWAVTVAVVTLSGFSVFSLPPITRTFQSWHPLAQYIVWVVATIAIVSATYFFGARAWQRLADYRAAAEDRRARADEYAKLLHEGWKRQAEWAQEIKVAAPGRAEKWRGEVYERLEKEFGQAVAIRFNRGATTYSLDVPQQFRDHLRRIDVLDELVREIRDGRLR